MATLDSRHVEPGNTLLDRPIQNWPDAWAGLRNLHETSPADAIVRVPFEAGGSMQVIDAMSLLRLAGFDPVVCEGGLITARRLEVITRPLSTSVVVPCRDEIGNVDALIRRLPRLGTSTELIFVDGASCDGTPERIEELIGARDDINVRLIRQEKAAGKASAVFEGFDAATGDILIILDADMTVAPEDLERFYLALAEARTRFANGTRFAFTMAAAAMPRANMFGNRAFSRILSWLLDTEITDTLCGTKALLRADWLRLRAIRHLFGRHDPWGDFDLLVGARYIGLDILDVPILYGARTSGVSKMHPFRDGWVLCRTCLTALALLRLRPAT